ncbi:hypothetical protein SKAU_G00351650 [Synaphobranchus kaupii]|uniref:Uncharacterized protein n=1 Tax=Synaphobranchus kaupii TaxID=118154 RepID=A0A9Q1II05_SYNKA|nr:hypothetical protein SKAU_G00351650 [Synaphobranchus kaupii]
MPGISPTGERNLETEHLKSDSLRTIKWGSEGSFNVRHLTFAFIQRTVQRRGSSKCRGTRIRPLSPVGCLYHSNLRSLRPAVNLHTRDRQ